MGNKRSAGLAAALICVGALGCDDRPTLSEEGGASLCDASDCAEAAQEARPAGNAVEILMANGRWCASDGECASGNCSVREKVCCDRACGGACETCTGRGECVVLKEGEPCLGDEDRCEDALPGSMSPSTVSTWRCDGLRSACLTQKKSTCAGWLKCDGNACREHCEAHQHCASGICDLRGEQVNKPSCVPSELICYVDANASAGSPDGSARAPYRTIQQCLDGLKPNISVARGIYSEQLKVVRSVQIIARESQGSAFEGDIPTTRLVSPRPDFRAVAIAVHVHAKDEQEVSTGIEGISIEPSSRDQELSPEGLRQTAVVVEGAGSAVEGARSAAKLELRNVRIVGFAGNEDHSPVGRHRVGLLVGVGGELNLVDCRVEESAVVWAHNSWPEGVVGREPFLRLERVWLARQRWWSILAHGGRVVLRDVVVEGMRTSSSAVLLKGAKFWIDGLVVRDNSGAGLVLAGSETEPKWPSVGTAANVLSVDNLNYGLVVDGGIVRVVNATIGEARSLHPGAKGVVFVAPGSRLELANTIVWREPDRCDAEAVELATNTDGPAGEATITSSFVACRDGDAYDPGFVTPGGPWPDFRLKRTSPLIDAGNDDTLKSWSDGAAELHGEPILRDLAGNPRSVDVCPGGAGVDIGAYELQGDAEDADGRLGCRGH